MRIYQNDESINYDLPNLRNRSKVVKIGFSRYLRECL